MLAVNENAKVLSVWLVSFPSKRNDEGGGKKSRDAR